MQKQEKSLSILLILGGEPPKMSDVLNKGVPPPELLKFTPDGDASIISSQNRIGIESRRQSYLPF